MGVLPTNSLQNIGIINICQVSKYDSFKAVKNDKTGYWRRNVQKR